MTSYYDDRFQADLNHAFVWESGIGKAVADIVSGHFTQTPYNTVYGQPSGDGVLKIGPRELRCEIKAEANFPSTNFCFETNGAGGRDSGLTLALGQVDVWLHYQGKTDTLIAVKPPLLLAFLQNHSGKSGIRFVNCMGDGGRAAGFIAPVRTITGVPGVRTFSSFSGTYLTGDATLHF